MSDLYHIPHDDGKTYRLKKFVEYQHEVPPVHYPLIAEKLNRDKADDNDIVNTCWIQSATYNELTTLLIRALLKEKSAKTIWDEYEQKLVFGSARAWVKRDKAFPELMDYWRRATNNSPAKYVMDRAKGREVENYRAVYRAVRGIPWAGRFATDLFCEGLVYMKGRLGIDIKEPSTIDWKNGNNLTPCVYNIFYEDERANLYDKKKTVSATEQAYLSRKIRLIQQEIHKTYPDQDADIALFSGKLCSFRNLFKGARYGGFHHDRQLGVLIQYEKDFPEMSDLWDECYDIRASIYPDRFLGEKHGWSGIRKERKKLWLKTGKTGAENE